MTYTSRSLLVPILLGVLVASGCTESNPAYLGDAASGDASWADGSIAGDGPILPPQDGPIPSHDLGPDIFAWPDLVPWPDVIPHQCKNNSECNDNLPCTVDSCVNNKCDNSLVQGFCAIGTKCYKHGELNPFNSCQVCQTAVNPKAWTPLGDGDPCAPDKLTCTSDHCKAGTCVHPLDPNYCLIDSACHADGAPSPYGKCQVCDAATNSWTKAPDGTPCTADNLWCTVDTCKAGACVAVLATGCLIGGSCHKEGDSPPGDACSECVFGQSKTAWTFVTGKPCKSGSGLAQICYANTCKGWTETTFMAPSATGATTLNAVDYIPPAKSVWAAGEFVTPNLPLTNGILVQLGPTSVTPVPVVASAPLRDLHYRLAVGNDGQAYYHTGTGWVQPSSLTTALSGMTRHGVWAAPVGSGEVAYLSGTHDNGTGEPGVMRCTTQGGSFSCTSHIGFANNARMGAVFGTLSPNGGLGPAWAVRTDAPGSEPEDIYFNPGSGTSWTRNPPQGCQDTGSGSSPCSNTSGAFLDMHGSSASDIWVVGSYGEVLHFDGSGWNHLTSKFTNQTSYTLGTVYSSPTDKLVIIAGYRNYSSGRSVAVITHNTELDRWFGPIQVRWSNNSWTDEIRGIGGQGFSNLWMVGRRVSLSSGDTGITGWILHFQ